MFLFIHYLIILYPERVEMYALVEREDGIAYRRVIGQSQILL